MVKFSAQFSGSRPDFHPTGAVPRQRDGYGNGFFSIDGRGEHLEVRGIGREHNIRWGYNNRFDDDLPIGFPRYNSYNNFGHRGENRWRDDDDERRGFARYNHHHRNHWRDFDDDDRRGYSSRRHHWRGDDDYSYWNRWGRDFNTLQHETNWSNVGERMKNGLQGGFELAGDFLRRGGDKMQNGNFFSGLFMSTIGSIGALIAGIFDGCGIQMGGSGGYHPRHHVTFNHNFGGQALPSTLFGGGYGGGIFR